MIFAAMHAGARSNIDDIIGIEDGVLVMLDNAHRIAEIAQPRKVSSSRKLSRWCRPIEGSSST